MKTLNMQQIIASYQNVCRKNQNLDYWKKQLFPAYQCLYCCALLNTNPEYHYFIENILKIRNHNPENTVEYLLTNKKLVHCWNRRFINYHNQYDFVKDLISI